MSSSSVLFSCLVIFSSSCAKHSSLMLSQGIPLAKASLAHLYSSPLRFRIFVYESIKNVGEEMSSSEGGEGGREGGLIVDKDSEEDEEARERGSSCCT